ncbi:hypothetical protein [Nocardia sp. NBC_00511]|uniref:hypothetical protein n=1 Tax=Nocardia sp. NBC_00511 TaxID=2903591 RepID=UPI0030E36C0F
MTIDITAREMTSDLSPEYAFRVPGTGTGVWRLSWLPRRPLTREQAYAGMELDEVLSDPDAVFDEGAHSSAATLAARIGIGVERAVILLAQRLAERLHSTTVAASADGEPGRDLASGTESEHGALDFGISAALFEGRVRGIARPAPVGARTRHRWG